MESPVLARLLYSSNLLFHSLSVAAAMGLYLSISIQAHKYKDTKLLQGLVLEQLSITAQFYNKKLG